MAFGDEVGLFWNEPTRSRATRGVQEERPVPPTPDTGWKMPTEFPSLKGQGMIAVDVESKDPFLTTKGPGYIRGDAYICGVAIGTEAGYRQYFPVAHQNGPNLDKGRVYEWLSAQLNTPGQPKVGANIRYDLEALTHEGVKIQGPYYDVQIAEPLLNENKLKYGLEELALEYLGEGKDSAAMYLWLRDAFGDKNIKGNIWRAPPEVVGPYAESDVDRPLRIFRIQKQLLADQGLMRLFEMESKLIPMLVQMRQRGVRIDLDAAEKMYSRLSDSQDEILKRIKLSTGVEVDIWAADSLARAYDAAGVAYPRTAKTNKPSFTKDWLTNNNHPVSRLIKEARHADKFKGTFVKGYILEGNINGRIHTQFNQLRSDDGGTISGRFSSNGPNLQNIPVRTDEGRLLREMFLADHGMLWWSLDWSQIEYRLIAHYAALMNKPGADEVVRRYLEDRTVDYHQLVADMTGLSRSNAKNLNFGLAYGQGIDLLCENLGVDREAGMKIINEYHMKAPFIRPLAKDVSAIADQRGFLKTIMNRRRRFDVFEKRTSQGMIYAQEPTPGFRRAFTHKALNALIQGSAADIMKQAMVDYYESGVVDVLGVPHLTVHDELDGSYDDTPIAREAIREVQHIMENVVELKVPLLADLKMGKLSWGECK